MKAYGSFCSSPPWVQAVVTMATLVGVIVVTHFFCRTLLMLVYHAVAGGQLRVARNQSVQVDTD